MAFEVTLEGLRIKAIVSIKSLILFQLNQVNFESPWRGICCFFLWPTAEEPSNYLSNSCSGNFANLFLAYTSGVHFWFKSGRRSRISPGLVHLESSFSIQQVGTFRRGNKFKRFFHNIFGWIILKSLQKKLYSVKTMIS